MLLEGFISLLCTACKKLLGNQIFAFDLEFTYLPKAVSSYSFQSILNLSLGKKETATSTVYLC